MKLFCKILLISYSLLLSTHQIKAQTEQPELNQVELFKQFNGTWKCDLGVDTFLIAENLPFGTGMTSSSVLIAKGDTLNEIEQLYGYDPSRDRFIISELYTTPPTIEILEAWFTSETTGELIVTHPDNAPFTFTFEFVHPNLLVQSAILEGEVVHEMKLSRLKHIKK